MNDRFSKFTLTLALAFLLAVAPAAAQDDGEYPRVGVGVTISDVSTLFADVGGGETGFFPVPSLLIPIDLEESLRIEPVLGYTQFRTERSQGTEEVSSTTSVLRLGAGLFARTLRDDAALYYGVRGGYNRLSTTFDDGDDDDDSEEDDPTSGFFVSPTLGGSYFFADFFSLGGEVEARYTRFSEEDEGFDGETQEITNSSIALQPSLVVRFYF